MKGLTRVFAMFLLSCLLLAALAAGSAPAAQHQSRKHHSKALKVRIEENGRKLRTYVCTRCLKSNKVVKAA